MSIKQYDLFEILIPENFKNVKYSKENLYLSNNNKNTLKHYKHKLEIYDISNTDYRENHLHEIYFFESEKYRRKYFHFNENLEKINIYFKIHFSKNSEIFKSIIPLLTISDFKSICNNFGINLIEKNQILIENEANNFSLSNNVIFIDSKPIIKLNHKKHLAIVSNVIQNIAFETKLYNILMETLNLCGSNLNILRDELHTLHFDNIDEKIIDNMLLKLQNKLDVINHKTNKTI